MQVTPMMLLTVCPLVFLAAAVDSIAGGGGLISLPAYLLTGIPPVVASGTNKFSACLGTLVASFRYAKGKRVAWRPALLAVLGALPGSFLGAELLKHAPEAFVRIFLLIAVPLAALLLLLRPPRVDPKPLTRLRLIYCALIGLAVGFYDGFFGPGTGTLLIMLFSWVLGMDLVTASGSAKLVNLASNLGALSALLMGGNVLWALGLPAMVCSMAGGYIGSLLALKKGARMVRVMMLGVLALLLIKLAFDYLGGAA